MNHNAKGDYHSDNSQQPYSQQKPQGFGGQPLDPVQKNQPYEQDYLALPLLSSSNNENSFFAKKIKIISITGIVLDIVFFFFNMYMLVGWFSVFLFAPQIIILSIGLPQRINNGRATLASLKIVWKIFLIYTIIWGVYYLAILISFIILARSFTDITIDLTFFYIAYFLIVAAFIGPRVAILITSKTKQEEQALINTQVY